MEEVDGHLCAIRGKGITAEIGPILNALGIAGSQTFIMTDCEARKEEDTWAD